MNRAPCPPLARLPAGVKPRGLRTDLREAALLDLRWNRVDMENGKASVKNTDTFRTKSRRKRGLHLDVCEPGRSALYSRPSGPWTNRARLYPWENVQSSWEGALPSASSVSSRRKRADGTPEVILAGTVSDRAGCPASHVRGDGSTSQRPTIGTTAVPHRR